jgi:hypothetical protein
VQVLYRQHQRLTLTGMQDNLPQQRKGPRPACLRTERCQGLHLPQHVQELAQQQGLCFSATPGRVQPLRNDGRESFWGSRVGQTPELPQQAAYR